MYDTSLPDEKDRFFCSPSSISSLQCVKLFEFCYFNYLHYSNGTFRHQVATEKNTKTKACSEINFIKLP
jgi:hypothetical protein